MFGERLKLARKKNGFSLRSLSHALDGKVSAQAIGKYERGEMMPSSSVLSRLAGALDVSLEYLLSEQVEKLEGITFRKISKTTVGDRARVEATIIDNLQRYIAIEEILEMDGDVWNAPRTGNLFLGIEDEGETLARDLREEWELGIDPIPDMTALLEDKGIKVLLIPLPEGVSGLSASVRKSNRERTFPVIVANRNVSLERRRLTLAHELAHLLIDTESPVNHEKAANIFAGALLVSPIHLARETSKKRNALGYQEILHLKRIYRVSGAAMLMRLRQLEIIHQTALTRAFQTFARKWRTQEPDPLEPQGEEGAHEAPSRFERLCYRALAEKLILPVKAGELLQQPLEEIEKGLRGPAETNADGSD